MNNDNETIDLGHKVGMPTLAELSEKESAQKVMYPEVHIHDVGSAALHNIPDEGELIVGHRVVGKEVREHGGKKHHSITLELHHLRVHSSRRKRHKLSSSEDEERAVDEYLK